MAGGGKGGGKVSVTKYLMSQHFGICAGPIDSISRIIVKEKTAWEGEVTTQQAFIVDNQDLFGGIEKEGGAEGVCYYLPGFDDQILDDLLAQKLGRSLGADCPGYRGIASIFMVGPAGTPFANSSNWSDKIKGQAGFYWSANIPYLPGVWVTVRRAPGTLAAAPLILLDYKNEIYKVRGVPKAVEECVEGGDVGIFTVDDIVPGVGLYLQSTGPGEHFLIRAPYLTPAVKAVLNDAMAGAGITVRFTFSLSVVGGEGQSFVGAFVTTENEEAGYYCAPAYTVPVDDLSGLGDFDSSIASRFQAFPIGGSGSHCVATTLSGAHIAASADGNACTVYSETPFPMVYGNFHTRSYAVDSDVTVATTIIEKVEIIHAVDDPTLELLSTGIDLQGTLGDDDGMIGGDANPSAIIFECLTNTDWGMGSPESAIDVASFTAAASTLEDEVFGLSMIWTQQASIQDFIQEVLDHIQAVLYVDPATGLLTLTLIRGDYDPDTLPDVNPSNANLSEFSRKLWGEIPNEIIVTWTNPETEQDETVTIQDLASIATQGGIVSDSRNYYGVRNATLAMQLAQRDLRGAGQPLASCTAEVDRTLWRVRPASVCKLTWPEYGLAGVAMRVIEADYGKPGDPTIKLSLIEDVFGFDIGQYVEPAESGWTDPALPPEPIEIVEVFTAPFFVAAQLGALSSTASVYPNVLSAVLATTANIDATGYELWNERPQQDGSLLWTKLATNNIMGHAVLVDDLIAEAESTGVTFAEIIGDNAPIQAGFVIIGDEGEGANEIAMFTAVGVDYTIARGVLDTVPRFWPAGTAVWFLDNTTAFGDPVVRSSGELVEYKLLMRTSMGLLALGDADLVTYTLTDRPWQPNRPADVTAHGVAFSSEESPIDATARTDPWVTVAWANRNRLLEDTQVLSWTDPDVGPETGQTTTIIVLATDAITVLATHTGLTGATFDVPDASFGSEAQVILRVSSSRTDADGTFESLQYFDHWVQVASVGSAAAAGAFAGVSMTIVQANLSAAGSASAANAGVFENLLLSGDASDGDDIELFSGDESGALGLSGV